MLPCRRGALLAKSAYFKKIPEDIQINHENYATNDPKTIEKSIQNPSQKWFGKNWKRSPQISPTLRFWIPFWSHLHDCFPLRRVFVATCFSEPSRGTLGTDSGSPKATLGAILASPGAPLERFWPPPGHPCSDVPHISDEFRNHFHRDVNDFRTPFPYFVNT